MLDKSKSHNGPKPDGEQFSPRQQEVLDAALTLIMEQGDQLTMIGVARRARCSKETLYKWFGDRQGLLTATVRWQASKVKLPEIDRQSLTLENLTEGLSGFAESWLSVLAGDISVALNRMAVGQAGADQTGLGQIVLHNGPYEMGKRLRPVLELGRHAGLLNFDDSETAFRTFFGLVVRDMQIRLLLGEPKKPSHQQIKRDAMAATKQFLVLHGTANPETRHKT